MKFSPGTDKAVATEKGNAIELALFRLYDNNVNSGYKSKNRTLLSNLLNKKNSDLRKNIMSGNLTASFLGHILGLRV